MELTRAEVVIVDFHRFPSGFPQSDQSKLNEIHKMMLDKVKNKLGKFVRLLQESCWQVINHNSANSITTSANDEY